MNNAVRFDNLDVYSQKLLADGAELALYRFKRTGHSEQLDSHRLLQLVNLFDQALEADRAILGAQMASSTDKSVSILGMVTEALTRVPLTDAVRTLIEQLKRITELAAKGTPLEEEDYRTLTSFLRYYSLCQEDRIRRLGSEMSAGGGLWPEPTRMMSL